jgi:hypothetical protein
VTEALRASLLALLAPCQLAYLTNNTLSTCQHFSMPASNNLGLLCPRTQETAHDTHRGCDPPMAVLVHTGWGEALFPPRVKGSPRLSLLLQRGFLLLLFFYDFP